jgi:hypothetical protein
MTMTYEEYLDEVTTLLTELYDLRDEEAIKEVMRAQANDFFTLHDDEPSMRTLEQAKKDAKTIFKQMKKTHAAPTAPGQSDRKGRHG